MKNNTSTGKNYTPLDNSGVAIPYKYNDLPALPPITLDPAEIKAWADKQAPPDPRLVRRGEPGARKKRAKNKVERQRRKAGRLR